MRRHIVMRNDGRRKGGYSGDLFVRRRGLFGTNRYVENLCNLRMGW